FAPFNLSIGPAFRGGLISTAKLKHRLVFSWHHIIFDFWSRGIFINQLLDEYRSLCHRQNSSGPPPRQSYLEYASGQNGAQGTAAISDRITYWRRKLLGAARIRLPQPQTPGPDKQELSATISGQTWRAWRERLRDSGVTPFQGALSLFAIALYRHSG